MSRSKVRISLLILSLLPGCAALAPEASERLSTTLPDGCEVQVDVQRSETPACWRLLCPKAKPRELGCDLTELHQVSEIEPSPDGRWLALISVGEGHPILEIADLQEWRRLGRYQSPCSVNPYPGTISMGGWKLGLLEVESDLDLTITQDDRKAEDIGERHRYSLAPIGCELVY